MGVKPPIQRNHNVLPEFIYLFLKYRRHESKLKWKDLELVRVIEASFNAISCLAEKLMLVKIKVWWPIFWHVREQPAKKFRLNHRRKFHRNLENVPT